MVYHCANIAFVFREGFFFVCVTKHLNCRKGKVRPTVGWWRCVDVRIL